MSNKIDDINFDYLEENSFLLLDSLIPEHLLVETNSNILNECLLNKQLTKLHGFKMGNLGIKSNYLHNEIWHHMLESGLINLITNRYPNLKYVSFGGNLNMPGSKKQRIHKDTPQENLIINVPLVDIDLSNGPLSVIPSNRNRTLSTQDIFFKRFINDEQFITLKKGDIVLRFSNAWHRGNINKTKNYRIMLSFTLRESYPNSKNNNSNDQHLIMKKNEKNSIEFLPNIYPLNFLGRFLEQLDYYAPSISMGLIHIRNIFIGK